LERSDVDVRKKEGLPETTGVLWGEEPPDKIEIVENGLRFWVDVKRGHKTGFYLDQRLNRQRALPYLRGEVLNAFAYTGAFGVYAAKFNNAHIVNLDASVSSLELARENFALNGVQANADYVVADAFQELRAYRTQGRTFDAIVLDPPKFVTSAANLERAARGYKDLNMLAFQLLKPNGFLVTFSCSGLLDAKLFQQIVFGASVDAKRDAQIVEKLGQSPDHPIGLHFPEGEYLKGLVVRVI
jgi:23S rRNA (cytosine1962-C5)-methyltransferase